MNLAADALARFSLAGASVILFGSLIVACNNPDHGARRLAPLIVAPTTVTVENHPVLVPTYPCSGCHANRTPNPTRRKLVEFHTAKNDFNHGTEKGWCYRCHSIKNLDELHVADGTTVSFYHPEDLCGSCHGDKVRDWRSGHHGLTRGYWNGPKLRRACSFCHNPHEPAFEVMRAEEPPDVIGRHAPEEAQR
jgi:hypothetical protein